MKKDKDEVRASCKALCLLLKANVAVRHSLIVSSPSAALTVVSDHASPFYLSPSTPLSLFIHPSRFLS